MKARIVLLFLPALLLPFPAQANLGETVEQCIARYGVPSGYGEASAKSPFGNVVFKAGPYVLLLFIHDDKEVGARVSKIDKSALSESELQTILGSESDPNWTAVTSGDPTMLQWSRSDHATAIYDKSKRMLILTSAEMAEALRPHAPPTAPSGQ